MNDEFRAEIQDSTLTALRSLVKHKQGVERIDFSSESGIDIEEGAKYLLEELAFLRAVPSIYENCDEFVFIYHRHIPLFEKYFGGHYDNIVKPCFGYVVYE